MILGIDVSENNGYVDWDAVKEAGVKFAIIRCSYGMQSRDPMFARNVSEAHARGIKCGAYHYGYGLNPDEARAKAINCKNAIAEAGVLLELPVFYDLEDADGFKVRYGFEFTQENCTEMCRTFLDNLGLNGGVYASYSWFCDKIDWQSLNCPVWNAQWGNSDDLKGYIWQFTDSLEIGGRIFDGNYMYLEEI